MRLTYAPAIDYLLGLAEQAVQGIRVNNKPVVAVDGWPTDIALGMFVIGLDQPAEEGQATATIGTGLLLATIGVQDVGENYTIPCYIDVRGHDTQKQVRDLTSQIFEAFWPLFAADFSLGGLLEGGLASVVDIRSTPLLAGTAPEGGRRQLLTFGIRCTNYMSV